MVMKNGQFVEFGRGEYGETHRRLRPEFFTLTVEDPNGSVEAGHKVYRDMEMVRFVIPGETQNVAEMKVRDRHKQEYAAEYEAWKAGRETPIVGIPLEIWPQMSPALARTLKAAHNIHTVEQLAEVSDLVLQKIGMGARSYRNQAIEYIKVAKDEHHASRLAAELSKRDDEITILKAQMSQLLEARAPADDESEPVRRGPGRPRKQETV